MKERKWVLRERERENEEEGGNAREREERGFNGLKNNWENYIIDPIF